VTALAYTVAALGAAAYTVYLARAGRSLDAAVVGTWPQQRKKGRRNRR
jgi:hypothetical protein